METKRILFTSTILATTIEIIALILTPKIVALSTIPLATLVYLTMENTNKRVYKLNATEFAALTIMILVTSFLYGLAVFGNTTIYASGNTYIAVNNNTTTNHNQTIYNYTISPHMYEKTCCIYIPKQPVDGDRIEVSGEPVNITWMNNMANNMMFSTNGAVKNLTINTLTFAPAGKGYVINIQVILFAIAFSIILEVFALSLVF